MMLTSLRSGTFFITDVPPDKRQAERMGRTEFLDPDTFTVPRRVLEEFTINFDTVYHQYFVNNLNKVLVNNEILYSYRCRIFKKMQYKK